MFTMGPPLWGGGAEVDQHFVSVILLMHFDGNYTDHSSLGQAFTSTGATLSATGAKFGQSANTNGNNPLGGSPNNIKSTAARSEYDLNSGDFTIECWANPSDFVSAGTYPIITLSTTGAVGMSLSLNGTASGMKARFDYEVGAGVQAIQSPTGTYMDVGSWYHVAGTRAGDTYRLFLNGELVSVTTDASRGANLSRRATVGNFDGISQGFYGLVDEVRVTKGVARYTASFTPPASPFPNA